jgi:hypothetical protein
MLISLEVELGYFQDSSSSSRLGESIFSSPSVPRSLCAFDKPLGIGDRVGAFSLSFVVVEECFRPGTGNENFDVRPIVSDIFRPAADGFL